MRQSKWSIGEIAACMDNLSYRKLFAAETSARSASRLTPFFVASTQLVFRASKFSALLLSVLKYM
jgi:hypothetical protein